MRRTALNAGTGLFLALAAAIIGCTQPGAGDPPASRIIVKFADASQPPPDSFEVRMPDGVHIMLYHERAMSGEAHVYNGRMSEDQLAAIIRKLNQRPEVDYAEADRKVSY